MNMENKVSSSAEPMEQNAFIDLTDSPKRQPSNVLIMKTGDITITPSKPLAVNNQFKNQSMFTTGTVTSTKPLLSLEKLNNKLAVDVSLEKLKHLATEVVPIWTLGDQPEAKTAVPNSNKSCDAVIIDTIDLRSSSSALTISSSNSGIEILVNKDPDVVDLLDDVLNKVSMSVDGEIALTERKANTGIRNKILVGNMQKSRERQRKNPIITKQDFEPIQIDKSKQLLMYTGKEAPPIEVIELLDSREDISDEAEDDLESSKEKSSSQDSVITISSQDSVLTISSSFSEGSIVRKRGRPRKHPLAQDVPPQNSVLNVPKRPRGRPRTRNLENGDDVGKAAPSDNKVTTVAANDQMERSRRGRKRKKINYFIMENTFPDDDGSGSDNPRKRRRRSSSSDEEFFDPKIRSVSVKQLRLSERGLGRAREAPALTEDPLADVDDALTMENGDKEEQEEGLNQQNRKYKFTGETSKLMASMFSAAFQPKCDTPEESTNRESTVSEENITCGLCKSSHEAEEWELHNKTVHYNLSWKEGQTYLINDDEGYLKRILKPILQSDKQLVCYKCDESYVNLMAYINHREECEGILKDGKYVCAVCEDSIEKMKWHFHKKRKHNNLTWRVGDPPIDLNNKNLVLNILNIQYKNKIPLYCYKCGSSKKSVIGFLSHQSQCGMALQRVQVTCEFCEKKMLPVSLQAHIKSMHGKKQDKKKVNAGNMVLGKRKAAKDALAMIDTITKENNIQDNPSKNISEKTVFKYELFALNLLRKELELNDIVTCKYDGCNFETKVFDEVLAHLEVCKHKPLQYFTCMHCLSIFEKEENVRDHIISDHAVQVPSNDEVSSEDEETQGSLVVRRGASTIKGKPRCIRNLSKLPQKLFQASFEYTLEFCNQHFTQSVLFDTMRFTKSDFNLIKDDVEQYLPKTEFSCEVSRVPVKNFENILGKNHDFKTYELFEVSMEENVTTIFCGGPVYAMAWLPTPHILLRCKQVLAVAVGNDFDAKYLVNMNYSEKCVIQFWDFGILKKKCNQSEPLLYMCLTIDYGPVWHLEWCPSGCYDENPPSNKDVYKRMGLLAVAGSNPDVCIYAIPFLDEEESGLIYGAKPLIRLRLTPSEDSKTSYFPTKIAWSKASEHKYVAVGYTNGIVAIFNLSTKSDMLRFTDEFDEQILLPYKTIKAHTHYISVLHLIHLSGGNRWLLTGSFDCNVYLWDLVDDTKVCHQRKKMVTDGVWLTNWVSYITTTDESNSKNLWVNACLSSPRNYLSEPTYISTCPSTLSSVSSSDWLNGIIHGSSMGEIMSLFPHQLLYCYDTDRKIKTRKYWLGFTKVIDKYSVPEERVAVEARKQKALQPVKVARDKRNPDSMITLMDGQDDQYNEYEPISYAELVQKYGLVFCDIKMNSFDDFSSNLQERLSTFNKELEISKPNLYPIQKINKVCFNPNCQASLYFATGYQAGFVRVSYMKFLENDRQVV